MRIFFSLGFVLISFFHYKAAYHWTQFALFLCFFTLIIGWKLWEKYHFSVSLLFCWVILNSLYISSYQWNFPDGLRYIHLTLGVYGEKCINPADALQLVTIATTICALSILLILYAVDFIAEKVKPIDIYRTIFLISLINAIYLIIHYFLGWNIRLKGGLFGVSAPNGIFIAATFPLIFLKELLPKKLYNFNKRIRIIVTIIIITSLYLMKASIPIGVLIVALCSNSFLRVKEIQGKVLICFSIIIIFLSVGYFTDENFLNSSHRFAFYKLILDDFFNKKNIWLGTGLGTFPIYGMGVQLVHKFMLKEWFMWAHSDFIQILYENGLIGLVLSINVFIWALIKTVKRPYLFAINCALGSAMVFSYPLRYGHLVLIYGLFIVLSFEKERN